MRLIERFPLWLRCTHWLNSVFLTAMIWSGLLIYWANDVYKPFFPGWFYSGLGIAHRLSEGIALHMMFAWLFTINGALYFAGLAVTGRWRDLAPRPSDFRDAFLVAMHDFGLRSAKPPMRGMLNAAQRIAYSSVLAIGIGSLVTGAAVYKPKQLEWLAAALGGYENARLLHFILTLAYAAFIAVHLVQVARAGWNSLRAMVAGFAIADNEEGPS